MKKNILLLILLCLAVFSTKAEVMPELLQDSTRLFREKLISKTVSESLKSQTVNLPNIDFDIPDLSMIDSAMEELDKKMLALETNLDLNISALAEAETQDGMSVSLAITQKGERNPTRVENKTFTNISEIEMDHKYGNIVVQETNAKQVNLEIQYFDTKDEKASCNISTSRGILFVATTSSGKRAKINYIITVPRNVALNVFQKYGNIKLGNYSGTFGADLSYTNLDAQSFSGTTPTIKTKYGNVNIGSLNDISLTASYSTVKIDKGSNIQVSGNYSNYTLGNIHSLSVNGSLAYGQFNIGTVSSVNTNLKYTNMTIDNLVSDIQSVCAYSDMRISSVSSSKLSSIVVKGSYSDLTITLPDDAAASFSADLIYGDFTVSKKHSVSYTENSTQNNRVSKRGQIGTKTPKLKIEVSNKYADIRIR